MACLTRLSLLRNCRKSLLQTTIKRFESNVVKEPKIEYKPPQKTWVSYGFSRYGEKIDRHAMHQTFFISVTLCIIGGGYLLTYAPEMQCRDWAQREAYLQLRRKEELGLEPIDPNFIDPSRIILPSDEELGDMEIII